MNPTAIEIGLLAVGLISGWGLSFFKSNPPIEILSSPSQVVSPASPPELVAGSIDYQYYFLSANGLDVHTEDSKFHLREAISPFVTIDHRTYKLERHEGHKLVYREVI